MDEQKKTIMKAELSALKGMIPASASMTAALQQTTYPVTGPVVNIPALATAAQVIKTQADIMSRMTAVMEKMLDEM